MKIFFFLFITIFFPFFLQAQTKYDLSVGGGLMPINNTDGITTTKGMIALASATFGVSFYKDFYVSEALSIYAANLRSTSTSVSTKSLAVQSRLGTRVNYRYIYKEKVAVLLGPEIALQGLGPFLFDRNLPTDIQVSVTGNLSIAYRVAKDFSIYGELLATPDDMITLPTFFYSIGLRSNGQLFKSKK